MRWLTLREHYIRLQYILKKYSILNLCVFIFVDLSTSLFSFNIGLCYYSSVINCVYALANLCFLFLLGEIYFTTFLVKHTSICKSTTRICKQNKMFLMNKYHFVRQREVITCTSGS